MPTSAGIASVKNSQRCPPFPLRARSSADRRFEATATVQRAAHPQTSSHFVKADHQEKAGLITQQWVHAHDVPSRPASSCPDRCQRTASLRNDRQESLMRAGGTFDARLFAYAWRPLVATRERIPRPYRYGDSRTAGRRRRRVRGRARRSRRSWPPEKEKQLTGWYWRFIGGSHFSKRCLLTAFHFVGERDWWSVQRSAAAPGSRKARPAATL